MWVEEVPSTHCSVAVLSCCQKFVRLARPGLRAVGQCLFVLAMLFIITGIALCIWGYLGTAIRPFQIFGPACIGVGVAVYVLGCILCCRDYTGYEKKMVDKERMEDVRNAIETLQQREVVDWIQGEPAVHEEFCQLAFKIFNNRGLYSESGNVVTNLYVNQLSAEV